MISRSGTILASLILLSGGPATAIPQTAPTATPSIAAATDGQHEVSQSPADIAPQAAPGLGPADADPPVSQLPTEVEPYVYFADLAWTAPDVHLVLRNGNGGEAHVRVHHTRTHPLGHPDWPETRSTEPFVLAAGAAAHPVYSVETLRIGYKPLDYVVVASDRPLHVGARAFGKKYAHEVLPFEIDCRDSGTTLDDGTPYGLLCWIAKHE